MGQINNELSEHEKKLEPWEVFDMIGGTSTGGSALILCFFSIWFDPLALVTLTNSVDTE